MYTFTHMIHVTSIYVNVDVRVYRHKCRWCNVTSMVFHKIVSLKKMPFSLWVSPHFFYRPHSIPYPLWWVSSMDLHGPTSTASQISVKRCSPQPGRCSTLTITMIIITLKFATPMNNNYVDWGNNINFIFIATWSQTRRNVRVAAKMLKHQKPFLGSEPQLQSFAW